MDKLSSSRIWMMRLVYAGLALVIMFFHLLPLSTLPNRWTPPDLLIALTFAWTMRRPDFVPIAVVAAVMLAADLLLQRPPGLLAALVVAGCAFLRPRTVGQSEAGFVGEWFAVGVVLVAITLVNQLILVVTDSGTAPLVLVLLQLVLTIAVYPLVVLASQVLFGVRRLAPSDAGAMGARS
ncbi:rod shape-determining protein MreD [Cribrihabitans marinus]|uniref:Rod shape-determining protein MreD n=1 Tax=Cribrihabitans marinus TaxID=1227549 RepID=A0A1H7CVI5_9RHOB|nr:rod shape-determining protein MreD [Cribrihabitans marinus]GGH35730.1 hypothetical protein GCM10010973_29270 [Cribrihabitans marinus]SEJ89835.1 rod shape-determining protein MreD [Cribrihabitans marinus]